MQVQPQNRRVAFFLPLLCTLLLSAPAVWAQGGGALDNLSGKDRPWAEGVSMEHQNKARELFQAANDLLMQQFFKQAATKYREALDYWDHPAVHYNMSLALMNLEQPIELYHALKKSLSHGVPPLIEEANYKRAENYLSLISQQISHVVITCQEEKARVTMDGKLLFIGPGAYEGVALAGGHTVAASKEGYLDNTKSVVLAAGQHERIEMKLFTIDDLTYEKRRFATWIPWVVVGGGAALLIGGGAAHAKARADFLSFDTEFDGLCTASDGCRDDEVPELSSRLNTATWTQRGAWLAYGLGGAAFATGVALFFVNQPKRIRREGIGTAKTSGVAVTPVMSPKMTGIRARINF